MAWITINLSWLANKFQDKDKGGKMDCKNINRMIKLAQRNDYKVCAWGTGYVGTNYGYELLKDLGITIDFYCDNNREMYGKEIKDGIYCIDKEKLPEQVVCFILTSGHLIADITAQLEEMGICHFVNYLDLCEYKAANFFDFQKRNQIAVYTCVVGEYDKINEPERIEPNCDYYIISDKKPNNKSVYEYIDIDNCIEPSIKDNTRRNRYCKINAHKIFPNYRYSIYIDGNIVIKGDITQYLKDLPKTRIIALTRTGYKSVYGEALRCMMHGRDDKERFLNQVEKYWIEGMPENFGLVLPTIMIREHNNPICSRLMKEWWEEVNTYSKRDVISLPYILWRNGYSINDIGTLSSEPDVLDGNEWIFIRNHFQSRIKEIK